MSVTILIWHVIQDQNLRTEKKKRKVLPLITLERRGSLPAFRVLLPRVGYFLSSKFRYKYIHDAEYK